MASDYFEKDWKDKLYIMAMGLEEHIKGYRPKGWHVEVKNPCGRHHITEEDANRFLNYFQEGMLKERLMGYQLEADGEKYLIPVLVREAVMDYYKSKKHEPIIRGDVEKIKSELFSR